MICRDCGDGHHADCQERNKNKQGADCDCQHRVRPKKEVAKGDGADTLVVIE
jgi:hypothetical protein